jgi:2-keto-4-pentenoate hydratase/2-oxohepta-3-ene-1,7-dioic acid hydratase in catechol pathway
MASRIEAYVRPQVLLLPQQQAVAVNNIFVIGRNYADDAAARAKAAAGTPVVALKPTSAIITEGEMIQLPPFSGIVHYEIELLMLVGRTGRHIPEARALDYIAGYGVGLDLIAHDLHVKAKQEGLPWAICKGFDTSAPVSAFIDASEVAAPEQASFTLAINGERRQSGKISEAIFGLRRIVSFLSTIFTLNPGDIIYTGTPSGVGALSSGDRLELNYNQQVTARFDVA